MTAISRRKYFFIETITDDSFGIILLANGANYFGKYLSIEGKRSLTDRHSQDAIFPALLFCTQEVVFWRGNGFLLSAVPSKVNELIASLNSLMWTLIISVLPRTVSTLSTMKKIFDESKTITMWIYPYIDWNDDRMFK